MGDSLTTFSPSGKLVQIEHALTAVGSGQKAANGVVITTEKKLPSILVDEASIQKIQSLTPTPQSVLIGENIGVEKGKKERKKRKKQVLQANVVDDEQYVDREGFSAGVNVLAVNGNNDKKKQLLKETAEEEQAPNEINPIEDKDIKPDSKAIKRIKKKKARLLQEAATADRRGICYLSRIPPHMDHVMLRHILSQYGEIQRIYLSPAAPTAQVHRKRAGNQDQAFSEGWVEFTNKSTAKRVANMLNGEQIGGRKRSQFYYDIWNIKYLSKFKWDNLTEEIAYKSAAREQKLALEISAAKRERDFYLTKVEKSRALTSIEERLKKKQKLGKESGVEVSVVEQAPKFIRQFPQKRPVVDRSQQTKSQLSKDILAGVFVC
ncbi:pre-rRNA-processing protein ESF2 isoform X2 [Euphorbia lathyris]|uniref:pre-rRNA-processing protein ESF2 isoform X2 n=1 Tax=Euphorbia lathyris TaxID=212925 RepID=UPI0033134194